MRRTIALMTILTACRTEPNPAYCDEERRCGDGFVCEGNTCVAAAASDAGVDGGCATACGGGTPYCSAGACVACLEASHCPGTAPLCGAGGACVPCAGDDECRARADAQIGICTPAGECLIDDAVLVVDAEAACGAAAAPFCQIHQAVAFAGSSGLTDIVVRGAAADYEPFTVMDQSVRVFGVPGTAGTLPAIRGGDGVNAVLAQGATAELELQRVTVRGASGGGKGVACLDAARCLLHRVTAFQNSYGVFMDGVALAEVTRSTVYGNNEGGIWLFRVADRVTLVNNFIYRNGSNTSGVGGVFLDGTLEADLGAWIVRSNSLLGNRSNDTVAPGVHCSQPLTIGSHVHWGHIATSVSSGCAVQFSSTEVLLPGNGNIAGDPRFLKTDPPEDLHLDTLSPCRNQGAPSAPADDIDGQMRDPMPDIGADELL